MAHGGGQGADERRDAAAVLRQGIAALVREHAREVVGLVRERRERRAHDRLRRLVDHRDEPRPQHLERDRVEPRAIERRRLHWSSVTTTLPVGATAKPARGGTTRAEPSSSITAGPANPSPTERRVRSYTIVSTNPFASGNQTGRRPLIGESPRRARPCSTTSLPATGARTATRTLMNSTDTSGGVSENFSR